MMIYILFLFLVFCKSGEAGIFSNKQDCDDSKVKAHGFLNDIPVGSLHLRQTLGEGEVSMNDCATGMLLGLTVGAKTKTIISCGHVLETFDPQHPIEMTFYLNGKALKVVDYLQLAPDPILSQDIALFYLQDPIPVSSPITLCSGSEGEKEMDLFTLSTGYAATLEGVDSLENLDGSMCYYQENTYQFCNGGYEARLPINGFLGVHYPMTRFPRLEYLAALNPHQSQTFIGDSGSPWLRKKEGSSGYELVGLTRGASSPRDDYDFEGFTTLVEAGLKSEMTSYKGEYDTFNLFYGSLPQEGKPLTVINDLAPIKGNVHWILENLC